MKIKPKTDKIINPVTQPTDLLSSAINIHNYSKSTEARILFKPTDLEEDALVAINNQIKLLKDAQLTSASYHLLLPAHPSKVNTEHDVFMILQKIVLLCMSLNNAARYMNGKTWMQCCKMALDTGKEIGLTTIDNPRTIMRWHSQFKKERKLCLPFLPNKMKLPPFLLHNHDVVIKINQYSKENIHRLSAQLILEYLHDTIIPEMIKERDNHDNKSQEEMTRELLQEYGLSSLTVGTVCRWMNRLGFKYDVRKKSYYVDGHERPGTIKYRKDFVKRYLSYERRAHRWIQITKEKHDDMVKESMFSYNIIFFYRFFIVTELTFIIVLKIK